MENEELIVTPPPKENIEKDLRSNLGILNATQNCRIVRLLKNLLGGKNGALTSHLSYLYQYHIFNGSNQSLANTIRTLATGSETHMQQLVNAIIAFGGCPKYTNGQGSPWSARHINYINNTTSQIQNNIKREEFAIKEIEKIIALSLNTSLTNVLQQIVNDKKSYIQILTRLL